MTIPPPCLLSLHILRPAGLSPLFLPQDTINALSDFLCFFYFLFQCKIPLIECFSLSGQLGVFFFPCLCRNYGLAVHHTFEISFRRRKQDLLGFGQQLVAECFCAAVVEEQLRNNGLSVPLRCDDTVRLSGRGFCSFLSM